ncbi:dehalogenase [Paraoerskovia sediminicola]|uniref:Dehalogenase n=1 Tax=Paraoerskovia sediminicola TaxID=1138587 RepID=A0ABM8G194_9CELL|nr:haloacid dehalogenase type II [Paraoerskovia sediminicola]BDZ41850.1 dehalogenase [Paraoerskovia sediminicola]
MTSAPALVVLDVNETLSDMSAMPAAFEAEGAPGHLAPQWFAQILRDGFALAAAGSSATFADLAQQSLRAVLAGAGPSDDGAVDRIMAAFTSLGTHPDVAPGLRALRALGVRVVTLSNGATSVADDLLMRAGVRDLVEKLLTVEDAERWKPAPESYAYALARCDVRPDDAMLVAAHPWDVDGAARAGLRTAWIDRQGATYPGTFTAPEVTARSLTDLAEQLSG